MSDRKATVNLPIDEWDDMRNKQQLLHNKIAELNKQLVAAERRDPTGKLEPILDTIEAAIPIIQFAVSNLHPDTVIGWPYEELCDFADKLTALPGATQIHKELAIELRAFSAQAEMRARERAARPVAPVTVPSTEAAFSPDNPPSVEDQLEAVRELTEKADQLGLSAEGTAELKTQLLNQHLGADAAADLHDA